jgi:ankyrin repeat protein
MKYLRLFEDFDSYDPYELMIIPPNKKAEMIMREIRKDEPNLNLVSDLIVLGANLEWKDEENGDLTPLHVAAEFGSVEIARMLIGAKADLNVQDKWEQTPLHVAANNGSVEIARMLIGAKADLNVQDEWEQTPLHVAARFGKVEIVRMLIDAGANVQSNIGYTPLHVAAEWGSVEIVRMLIDAGADKNILNGDGRRWDQLIDDEEYDNYDDEE